MEKNIEIEKKYLLIKGVSKENAIKRLISLLKLKNCLHKVLINEDTYYDEFNILNSHGLNARQRKVQNKTEYTLKIKVDTAKIDKREELNFSSLEEMLKYINANLHLPISQLTPNLKLLTRRHLYYYQILDTLIEICFDEVKVKFQNEPISSFFMLECEFKKGDTKQLSNLNNLIMQTNFFKPSNLSKKDIAIRAIDSHQKLIRQRTKN